MIKNNVVTEQDLRDIKEPVDIKAGSYISYGDIIDKFKQGFKDKNLVVQEEKYIKNSTGSQAVGTYIIETDNDTFNLVYTWSNAYDRTMRFQCAVGVQMKEHEDIIMLSETNFNIVKKRSSNITEQAEEFFTELFSKSASKLLDEYSNDKSAHIQNTRVNKKDILHFVADLFFDDDLSVIQLNAFKKELENLISETDEKDVITLWGYYSKLLKVLEGGSIKSLIESYTIIDTRLKTTFYKPAEVQLDGQLSIEDDVEDTSTDTLDEGIETPETLNDTDFDKVESESAEEEIQEEIIETVEDTSDEEIKAHVETDEEYNAKIVDIEGESEVKEKEDNKFDKTVAEYNGEVKDLILIGSKVNGEYSIAIDDNECAINIYISDVDKGYSFLTDGFVTILPAAEFVKYAKTYQEENGESILNSVGGMWLSSYKGTIEAGIVGNKNINFKNYMTHQDSVGDPFINLQEGAKGRMLNLDILEHFSKEYPVTFVESFDDQKNESSKELSKEEEKVEKQEVKEEVNVSNKTTEEQSEVETETEETEKDTQKEVSDESSTSTDNKTDDDDKVEEDDITLEDSNEVTSEETEDVEIIEEEEEVSFFNDDEFMEESDSDDEFTF